MLLVGTVEWPRVRGYMLRGRLGVMAATSCASLLRGVAPRTTHTGRSSRGYTPLNHAHAQRTPKWERCVGKTHDYRSIRFMAVPASAAAEGVEGAEGLDRVEGVQSRAKSTTTPIPQYTPQPSNYAGAGAVLDEQNLHADGHVALIDGMSVIFRSFYGWQARGAPLLDSKDNDISVQYSVAHAVLAILELPNISHVAVCFDAKGKTFRHEMFADYKANRPETPPEIKQVIPKVIEMVQNMGIPTLVMSGVEADDIIGTLTRRSIVEANLKVSIVSPDKDFFQLLGPRVRQLRPNGKNKEVDRSGDGADSEIPINQPINDCFDDYAHPNLTGKGLVPYTEKDFRNEFLDLDPAQFVDLLAMVGDASDNVPGVEGIGPKTAPKLLKLYGNIEGCIRSAEDNDDKSSKMNKRIRENLSSEKGAATAYLCRSLVTIRTSLSAPTLNSPALPFYGPNSLELLGRVPPQDGGLAVGEYLERGLELGSAADRWREVCRRRSS
mgnify:CR=1 FL=1